PSNTRKEMLSKQAFYQKYGVLEMFFYDPDTQDFWGFTRQSQGGSFLLITPLHLPWTSPTLGIKFELGKDGLVVFYPDGERFKDPGEFAEERDQAFAKLRELGIDPTTL
ncbi:MAG: Uma2 family endonuclease, partial [Okeania sp. SIO2D1]|nr:Uma2 family endonuclease [Okeania sp. SIO2D1]